MKLSAPHIGQRLVRLMIGVLLSAEPGMAQSPAEMPLEEGGVTRIECRWDRDEALPGFDPDKKPGKGAWHYDAFVPAGYAAGKERRYPCLFISSPIGGAGNQSLHPTHCPARAAATDGPPGGQTPRRRRKECCVVGIRFRLRISRRNIPGYQSRP